MAINPNVEKSVSALQEFAHMTTLEALQAVVETLEIDLRDAREALREEEDRQRQKFLNANK